MIIREFWEKLLPQFENQQFIYAFLDIAFILIFFKAIFYVPDFLLNGGRHSRRRY